MSRTLQWLLWGVVLIIGLDYLLGMRDGLRELTAERQTVERLRSREMGNTAGVDWKAEGDRARAARADWMSRLPVYSSRGLFNAGAMESMGAICEGLKLGCQVQLTDDAPTAGSNAAAAATSGTASGAAGAAGRQAADARKAGALPPMVSSARVKVSAPFQPESLRALVSRLESGDQLRTIDRVTVAGARMDLLVRVFAVESDAPAAPAASSKTIAAPASDAPPSTALRLGGRS